MFIEKYKKTQKIRIMGWVGVKRLNGSGKYTIKIKKETK